VKRSHRVKQFKLQARPVLEDENRFIKAEIKEKAKKADVQFQKAFAEIREKAYAAELHLQNVDHEKSANWWPIFVLAGDPLL